MPRKRKESLRNEQTKETTLPAKFKPGFLAGMDSRTGLARALKGNRDAIVQDLGGEAACTHLQVSLVERFVWTEAYVGHMEQEIASGNVPPSEIGRHIQMVNTLVGLAKSLGLSNNRQGSQSDVVSAINSVGAASNSDG